MWFYNTNILFIPHPTYSLTGDFFSKHPTHTLVNPLSNSPSKLSKNGLRWYVPMGWWNSDFEFLIFNLKIVEIAYLLHFPAFLLSCPRHQTYALNVGRVDRIDVFAIFGKMVVCGNISTILYVRGNISILLLICYATHSHSANPGRPDTL